MDVLYAALIAGYIVTLGVLAIRQKRQLIRDIEADFRAQSFSAAHGPVPGRDWLIVSKRRSLANPNNFQRSLPGAPRAPTDETWYCIGPHHEYLAVLLLYEQRWKRLDIQWSARTLTQERFRAALLGDRKGLRELARLERQTSELKPD